MTIKSKIILCTIICGYGISADNQCLAMQRGRTQAQEAERRKRYWQDQFNVHQQLKDKENDIQWLQKFQKTIISYGFATAAELEALAGVQSSSTTVDAPAENPTGS